MGDLALETAYSDNPFIDELITHSAITSVDYDSGCVEVRASLFAPRGKLDEYLPVKAYKRGAVVSWEGTTYKVRDFTLSIGDTPSVNGWPDAHLNVEVHFDFSFTLEPFDK